MKFARAYWSSASFLLSATAAWAEVDEGTPPQMDTSWFPNQLFWLAVSFLLMYILVARFVAPSIKGVLDKREGAINEAIAEAERAKAAAASTRGSANSESHAARAKAAEIMAQAQGENSKDAAKELAKLDHEITRRANHAAAALDDIVANANENIEASIQDLAEAITEKLLGGANAVESTGPKLKLAKR